MNYKIYEGKIIGWNWNGETQTDKIELLYAGTDYCMIYNKILQDYEDITQEKKYKHLHFLIWQDDIYNIKETDSNAET